MLGLLSLKNKKANMNYYQHHIGDFNNATRHLTRVERSLYRDLIELYYDTEKPLIDDIAWLERKMMAKSDEESDALLVVLNEFFTLEEDGYHNSRCDIDIGKYHSNTMAKVKAGKASAAKRKQTSTAGEQVLSSSSQPITNNHKPITKDQDRPENLKTPIPKDFQLNDTNQNWVNNSNLTFIEKSDLIKDFVDYWTLDESKKTLKGWQMAFRKNPIVKRKIVNSKHKGQNNGSHQQNHKPSLAERATNAREEWERNNP